MDENGWMPLASKTLGYEILKEVSEGMGKSKWMRQTAVVRFWITEYRQT